MEFNQRMMVAAAEGITATGIIGKVLKKSHDFEIVKYKQIDKIHVFCKTFCSKREELHFQFSLLPGDGHSN